MKIIERIVCAGSMVALLAVPAGAEVTTEVPVSPPPNAASQSASPAPPPKESSFDISGRFTAQRRPRVTVLEFQDTNKGADDTGYGSSVEAMLVTFLKRKSQFVVVERQKLGGLNDEKQRIQKGMIKMEADDKAAQELLEKLDAFILGSVTLLDIPAEVETVSEEEEAIEKVADALTEDEENDGWDEEEEVTSQARQEKRGAIRGPRIEIDVKLLSRFDGRIIAAAQRNGPVACLRSIVERLGVAIEQEYLRPYYGKLTFRQNEPANVRVYLTPILPEDALDEEKPPVERSTTVTIAGDHDIVEPWTTDPTAYTIENLLSGWYSMRLERPGYEELRADGSSWVVRKRLGKEVVYDLTTGQPLDSVDPSERRFVVRVDPRDGKTVDGNALKFAFRKEGGAIKPVIKRQFVDGEFSHTAQRVILIGDKLIKLNNLERPDEYADDAKCDLFDEKKPFLSTYGRTYISPGQSFDFASFTGGELIIEDYRGEIVPVGTYRMAIWEPSYQLEKTKVTIRDKDNKPIKASLTRETAALELITTGTRPANQVTLVGTDTGQRFDLLLDFEEPKELPSIPVDSYTTSTNIPGLDGWNRSIQMQMPNLIPPFYDIRSARNKPQLIEAPRVTSGLIPRVGVKTRFGLAGRLEVLSQQPDPLAADLYIDHDLGKILNLLLYGAPIRPGEEKKNDFWQAAAEAGRMIAPLAAAAALPGGSDSQRLGTALLLATARPEPSSVELTPESQREAVLQTVPPPPPPPPAFPRDPDTLRKLLAQRLELIDLLILDPIDMVQLRKSPEVAAIVARYVSEGGSLFAFISAAGDYRHVIGAPLAVDTLSKPTRRFALAPGEVDGLLPPLGKKDGKVKAKRALPEIAELPSSWRVLAYTKGGKGPRIVETGRQDAGGYVALWLDDPDSFRSRWGGTRPRVQETRAKVEEHVLGWARKVMRRRFDRSTQASQPCAAPTVMQ